MAYKKGLLMLYLFTDFGWQGPYIGQMALKFGANDLGSTMMEENVVKSAGAGFRMAKDEMIHLIHDIGEIPGIRNTAYETLEKFA